MVYDFDFSEDQLRDESSLWFNFQGCQFLKKIDLCQFTSPFEIAEHDIARASSNSRDL